MNGHTHERTTPTATRRGPAGAEGAAADPASRTTAFNDYASLLNAFQELAAAALNRGGEGLAAIPLGRDLSAKHRDLLEDVRRVLLEAREDSREAKQSAAADWRRLAVRLEASLDEARRVGISGRTVAAAADDVVLIGQAYGGGGRGGPDIAADYTDLLKAIGQLVGVFGDAGEATEGMGREELQGRPDIKANEATKEVNAHQREKLAAVPLGEHLSPQHRVLVEKVRATLVLARSEGAGSAYRAVAGWKALSGELRYVLERAPTFVEGDIAGVAKGVEQVGADLARHYELVHREDVGAALRTEAKPGEERAEREVEWAAAGAAYDPKELRAALAIVEARRHRDLRHALTIIEHGLAPIPARPGEWLLTSGGTKLRLRDDEVQDLRAMAAAELKAYIDRIASAMAAVYLDYDSIKRGNSSFKLHVLGGWGGATDPGDMNHWRVSVINVRDTMIYPRIREGKFVEAYDGIMNQKAIVEERAKEVAEYDGDLDKGYSRLSFAMQLTQVALTSLVPAFGEAALASGYGVFAVGGAAVAAGGGGAFAGEGARQWLSGEEPDVGKMFGAGRRGAAIGLGTVAAPATKALGGALGSATPGVTGVMAESAASAVTSGAQSLVAGDPVLASMGAGGISGIGGRLSKSVEALTRSRTAGVVTSAGVGVAASAATGQDLTTGAVGAGVGHLASNLVPRPATGEPTGATGGGSGGGTGGGREGEGGGGGGGRRGDDAVPHLVDPASEPTVWAVAPSEGVPVEIPEDPTYHGPAPSTGVPEHVDDAPTVPQPAGPFDPTPATGVPGTVDPLAPTPATGVPVPIDDEPATTPQPAGPFDPTPPAGVPGTADPLAPTPATGVPVPIHDEPATAPRPGVRPSGSAAFRLRVREALANVKHGTDEATVNAEWRRYRPLLDTLPADDATEFIRRHIDDVFAAVRSRELIEDVIVEIWERAQADNIPSTEALLRIAGDRPDVPQGVTFPRLGTGGLTATEMRAPLPFVDVPFMDDWHGAYSHMVQELAVARVLGGPAAAARFREQLSHLPDPPGWGLAAESGKHYWERCWDAVFDSEVNPTGPKGHINRPEVLGPILHMVLGFPGQPFTQ